MMVELAKVLYGSQNYGLDGEDSDRDYKLVLCPGFDELYEGKMCKKNIGEQAARAAGERESERGGVAVFC